LLGDRQPFWLAGMNDFFNTVQGLFQHVFALESNAAGPDSQWMQQRFVSS
jgi:hypothetical protein